MATAEARELREAPAARPADRVRLASRSMRFTSAQPLLALVPLQRRKEGWLALGSRAQSRAEVLSPGFTRYTKLRVDPPLPPKKLAYLKRKMYQLSGF